MKAKRVVTTQEFEEGLQIFVGKKLTRFYYITDSMVVFHAGKESLRPFEDKPVYDSEFEFWIIGGWEYLMNGKVIETSIAKGEELPELRKRIRGFIESIHPTKVTSITVSANGQTAEVILDLGGKFVVHAHNGAFLNFSHRVYEEDGFVEATHLRPDEETSELTLFTANRD